MPVGLAMPVGVTPNGGAKLVDGEENDNKIVRLALMSDENDNAFQQDISLGQSMIFELSDGLSRATTLQRLRIIFERFQAQRRYKLKSNTIRWYSNQDPEGGGKEGESILEFRYLSLEANEERLYQSGVSTPGSTGGN